MSACRYCGKPFEWRNLGGGVMRPFNADGTRHGCQGRPARSPTVRVGGRTGQPIPECQNPCGKPPWEACACSWSAS